MSKICLINDENNKIISGNDENSMFTVRISKQFEGWEYRILDFLAYETLHGRTVVTCYDKYDYDHAVKVYSGHSIRDKQLRPYEPKFMIHSTTKENWAKICESKTLKSWNLAKLDGDIDEEYPIGKKLGDFDDYSDYIMLAGGGHWNEVVVASKQKGELCYDKNQTYEPGARIYFDLAKIAQDGLLVRDGIHTKVKDRLPIEPYVIWIAEPKNLVEENIVWTPDKFAKMADEYFYKMFSRYNNN